MTFKAHYPVLLVVACMCISASYAQQVRFLVPTGNAQVTVSFVDSEGSNGKVELVAAATLSPCESAVFDQVLLRGSDGRIRTP